MSSDPGPGPAYELQPSRSNKIVDATHYVTTFVIALIIQDYIKNALELFVRGISNSIKLLLAAGLVVLLVFAFESYLTATGRSDTLHRHDLPFEIVRAILGLFALFGLHNFSLILTRLSIDNVTAAAIASQFGWGLAVVYISYMLLRIVVTGQNYLLGENPWERPTFAVVIYAVYALLWAGFAVTVSQLGSWLVSIWFAMLIIITLSVYFWFWRERFDTLLGLDVESVAF